jgi:3-oxoacyl-[acyl-carrier protein] reductase
MSQTQSTQQSARKLDGKVAIVTGASKGIGAGIARRFASEGASVVVNYSSSKSGADKVVSDVTSSGGKAIAVQADLSKPDEITRLFTDAHKAFGKLDILVNNAGIYEFAPLGQITPEHFHKIFDLNVLGLILATQEALKYFTDSGVVINIGSGGGTNPLPGGTVYGSTKAAVDLITKTHAKELGSRNIRVNALNPGPTVTEGTDTLGINDPEKGFEKMFIASTPLGRLGQPDDIAKAAVFLTSDDSGWLTGEIVNASGGYR